MKREIHEHQIRSCHCAFGHFAKSRNNFQKHPHWRLHSIKGQGIWGYKNFCTDDWLVEHTKVEIFVDASKVDLLPKALLTSNHDDPPGAGIVAVMPVERFLHLRTGTETLPEEPPI